MVRSRLEPDPRLQHGQGKRRRRMFELLRGTPGSTQSARYALANYRRTVCNSTRQRPPMDRESRTDSVHAGYPVAAEETHALLCEFDVGSVSRIATVPIHRRMLRRNVNRRLAYFPDSHQACRTVETAHPSLWRSSRSSSRKNLRGTRG